MNRNAPVGKITFEVAAELRKSFRTRVIEKDTSMQDVLEAFVAQYVGEGK